MVVWYEGKINYSGNIADYYSCDRRAWRRHHYDFPDVSTHTILEPVSPPE
jgi:hypothetical protein